MAENLMRLLKPLMKKLNGLVFIIMNVNGVWQFAFLF